MPFLDNHQHELFCREYSRLGNASQAARLVGYSEKSAGQQGHALLKKPEILARLAELNRESMERLEVTEDKVMSHLAAIAFQNIDDFMRYTPDGEPIVDPTQASPIQRAAIKKMRVDDYLEGRGEDAREVRKIEIELHPKLPALIKLGEKYGYFRDGAGEVADATMEIAREFQRVMTGNSPFPIATQAAREAAQDGED